MNLLIIGREWIIIFPTRNILIKLVGTWQYTIIFVVEIRQQLTFISSIPILVFAEA